MKINLQGTCIILIDIKTAPPLPSHTCINLITLVKMKREGEASWSYPKGMLGRGGESSPVHREGQNMSYSEKRKKGEKETSKRDDLQLSWRMGREAGASLEQ